MKLASIAMPGDELPSGHDGAGFIVDERSVGGDPQIACVHRLNAVKTMMCALFRIFLSMTHAIVRCAADVRAWRLVSIVRHPEPKDVARRFDTGLGIRMFALRMLRSVQVGGILCAWAMKTPLPKWCQVVP